MASRGRGRRGRPRGDGRPPPVFDQQAFIEAMGAAIATASQADAARGQGGASNLQRCKAHHPPTFTGGGDRMVADHWFRQIERILRAMQITSDTTRITLASFQLEGESQIWWEWVTTSRDLETMTWDDFRRLSMGKYFPASARHAKAREFLELRQGTMTVLEYVARFFFFWINKNLLPKGKPKNQETKREQTDHRRPEQRKTDSTSPKNKGKRQ